MLVSISFQFIGFLLTYLLHTTHAARLGSRAGLGVTLIQFGFTLRANLDGKDGSDGNVGGGGDWPGWMNGDTSESELINNLTHNGTLNSATAMASDPDGNVSYMTSAGIATNEWLSFFLMTIGKSLYHPETAQVLILLGFRLVHPLNIPPWFLAGQALGTWHPRLSAAIDST